MSDDDWWRTTERKPAPKETVEVRLDRADRGDNVGQFAAPVRGGPGNGTGGLQPEEDLDSLLADVGRGFGSWDGGGVFGESGQKQQAGGGQAGRIARAGQGRQGGQGGRTGRRRRTNRVSDDPTAAFSNDHQDPSADTNAVFGGTAPEPGPGDGSSGGGGSLTEDEIAQIRKLKEALAATKRKLDRAREDLNDVEDELETKEVETAELRSEKEAADRERIRTQKEYEKAQKAAKKRATAAQRRASALNRVGGGDGDDDDQVFDEDEIDDTDLGFFARLLVYQYTHPMNTATIRFPHPNESLARFV